MSILDLFLRPTDPKKRAPRDEVGRMVRLPNITIEAEAPDAITQSLALSRRPDLAAIKREQDAAALRGVNSLLRGMGVEPPKPPAPLPPATLTESAIDVAKQVPGALYESLGSITEGTARTLGADELADKLYRSRQFVGEKTAPTTTAGAVARVPIAFAAGAAPFVALSSVTGGGMAGVAGSALLSGAQSRAEGGSAVEGLAGLAGANGVEAFFRRHPNLRAAADMAFDVTAGSAGELLSGAHKAGRAAQQLPAVGQTYFSGVRGKIAENARELVSDVPGDMRELAERVQDAVPALKIATRVDDVRYGKAGNRRMANWLTRGTDEALLDELHFLTTREASGAPVIQFRAESEGDGAAPFTRATVHLANEKRKAADIAAAIEELTKRGMAEEDIWPAVELRGQLKNPKQSETAIPDFLDEEALDTSFDFGKNVDEVPSDLTDLTDDLPPEVEPPALETPVLEPEPIVSPIAASIENQAPIETPIANADVNLTTPADPEPRSLEQIVAEAMERVAGTHGEAPPPPPPRPPRPAPGSPGDGELPPDATYREQTWAGEAGNPNRDRTPEELEAAKGQQFLHASQFDPDSQKLLSLIDEELMGNSHARQVVRKVGDPKWEGHVERADIQQLIVDGGIVAEAPQVEKLTRLIGGLMETWEEADIKIDQGVRDGTLVGRELEVAIEDKDRLFDALTRLQHQYKLIKSEAGRVLSMSLQMKAAGRSKLAARSVLQRIYKERGIIVDDADLFREIDEIFRELPHPDDVRPGAGTGTGTGAGNGTGTGAGDAPAPAPAPAVAPAKTPAKLPPEVKDLPPAIDDAVTPLAKEWEAARKALEKARTAAQVADAAEKIAKLRRQAKRIIDEANEQKKNPLKATKEQEEAATQRRSARATLRDAEAQRVEPLSATPEDKELAKRRREQQALIDAAKRQSKDPVLTPKGEETLEGTIEGIKRGKQREPGIPDTVETVSMKLDDFSLNAARDANAAQLRDLKRLREGKFRIPQLDELPDELIEETSRRRLWLAKLERESPTDLSPDQIEELETLRALEREMQRRATKTNPIEQMALMVDREMSTLDERVIDGRLPDREAPQTVHDEMADESEEALSDAWTAARKASRSMLSDEAVDKYFQSLVDRGQLETAKQRTKPLTRPERIEQQQRRKAAQGDPVVLARIERLRELITRRDKQPWIKAWLTARRADMLKNSITGMVNLTSGAVSAGEKAIVIPAFAGAIDAIVSRLANRPRRVLAPTRETLRASIEGGKEGAARGFTKQQIIHGVDPGDPLTSLQLRRTNLSRDFGVNAKVDAAAPGSTAAKGWGVVKTGLDFWQLTNDITFGVLNATDMVFFRSELTRSNTERAILRFMQDRGYKSVQMARRDPGYKAGVAHYMDVGNQSVEDAIGVIVDAADATFKNRTGASKALRELAEKYSAVGYVVPFTTVPTNIALQVIERMPIVGWAPAAHFKRAEKEMLQRRGVDSDLIAKVMSRRNMQAFAKQGVGAAILMAGYTAAQAALATGAYARNADSDDRLRASQQDMEGSRSGNFQLGEGGDHRQTYAFGPLGVLFSVGAAVRMGEEERMKGTLGERTGHMIAEGARSLGQNFLEVPFMQGVSRIQSLVAGTSNAGRFAGREVASMIPFSGTLAQSARVLDRTTADRALEDHGFLPSARDALKERLPGLRNTLPVAHNALGETMPAPNVVEALLDPTRPRTDIGHGDADVAEMMERGLAVPEEGRTKDIEVIGTIKGMRKQAMQSDRPHDGLRETLNYALKQIPSANARALVEETARRSHPKGASAALLAAIDQALELAPIESMEAYQRRIATSAPVIRKTIVQPFLEDRIPLDKVPDGVRRDMVQGQAQKALQTLLSRRRAKHRDDATNAAARKAREALGHVY